MCWFQDSRPQEFVKIDGLACVRGWTCQSRVTPNVVRRLLGGTPRRSAWLSETLLPKWLALPVFASDPICSVAYTTEQIVLVLAAGGLAALMLTPWAGLAVVVLSVGFVVVLVLANLRGTKESGQAFAVPTYMFIGLTFLMFFIAVVQGLIGGLPPLRPRHRRLRRPPGWVACLRRFCCCVRSPPGVRP